MAWSNAGREGGGLRKGASGRRGQSRNALLYVASSYFLMPKRLTQYVGTGTTLAPAVSGAKWVNERYAALAPSAEKEGVFVPAGLDGGNHFAMATDPEVFGRSVGQMMQRLGVQ